MKAPAVIVATFLLLSQGSLASGATRPTFRLRRTVEAAAVDTKEVAVDSSGSTSLVAETTQQAIEGRGDFVKEIDVPVPVEDNSAPFIAGAATNVASVVTIDDTGAVTGPGVAGHDPDRASDAVSAPASTAVGRASSAPMPAPTKVGETPVMMPVATPEVSALVVAAAATLLPSVLSGQPGSTSPQPTAGVSVPQQHPDAVEGVTPLNKIGGGSLSGLGGQAIRDASISGFIPVGANNGVGLGISGVSATPENGVFLGDGWNPVSGFGRNQFGGRFGARILSAEDLGQPSAFGVGGGNALGRVGGAQSEAGEFRHRMNNPATNVAGGWRHRQRRR